MKNKFILTAVAGLFLLPSCTINIGNSKIKYTHLPPEGKNMPVQPFTSIKTNGIFNIFLQEGSTESLVVKDEYPNDLVVTNHGDTLLIMDTINNHNGNGGVKTNIYVTYKQLNNFESESVGQTKTLDTIKAVAFNFTSDGVGESIFLINADTVTAAENGVGALNISGKAHYARIDDNGVGALKAQNFKVDILHASINGVGAAKVYASSEIYLSVSGIGGVKYYGPAKVMEQTSSGIGKIEHGE